MVVISMALVGIAMVIAGVLAVSSVRHLIRQRRVAAPAPVVYTMAIALGALLAIASFFLTGIFGYPYARGRIVGVPFMVAFFDERGFDYVGPLSFPAAIGNAIVWFLLPWIGLAIYGRVHRRVSRGV